MMKKQITRSSLRIIAIILLFITGAGALAAGFSFIVEPSGEDVGLSTDYLRRSAPFKNYFIPGIILFTVIGILSCLIAVAAIRKSRSYAWLIIMQGTIYVGWIAIQLSMVTLFHPLHAIVGAIGLALIITGSLLKKDFFSGEIFSTLHPTQSLFYKKQ